MCPRKETMNLNFVENRVGLRVYPSVCAQYKRAKISISMEIIGQSFQ